MTDTLGNQLNLSLGLLLPELILAATALVVVFVDMFQKELKAGHGVLPVLALIGLVAAAVATGTDIDKHDSFARMVSIDNFTAFFRFLFIGVAIVLIVGSHEYIERHVLLQAVDRNWQNHLTDMDELRRAVFERAACGLDLGRVSSALRMTARASLSSLPLSSSRGGRTRALPMPTSCCTSLMSLR